MDRRRVLAAALVLAGLAAVVWRCRAGNSTDSGDDIAAGTDRAAAARRAARERAATASLSGRVIRKIDGAPIPDAVVAIALAGQSGRLLPTDELAVVVVTDGNGVWWTPIAAGGYVVAVTARGYLPAQLERVVVAKTERKVGVDLQLEVGGTLVRGTVTDAGGGPIANARVTASNNVADSGYGVLCAITAADGSYALSLREGNASIAVTHDDYVADRTQLGVPRIGPIVRDFVLLPGVTIRGQVTARDTGQPVGDAYISATSSNDGYNILSTRAADDGSFELRGVAPGQVQLSATARGYATSEPARLAAGVGEQTTANLMLDRAFTIAGRVVVKGAPHRGITDVRVYASPIYHSQRPREIAPSDADGRFEIVGARAGYYELGTIGGAAVNAGWMEGHSVHVVDRDVTDVVVELELGATITGRLDPPSKGQVVACGYTATAGDDGRFVIEHLRPGKCVVAAKTADGRGGRVELELDETGKRDVVVAVAPLASVSGRVLDARGNPQAGVLVQVERDGALPDRGTTNGDGTFRILGLTPGTVRVVAGYETDGRSDSLLEPARHGPVELVAGVETSAITLTLTPPSLTLHGRVIGTDGTPSADAIVVAHLDDGGFGGSASPPVVTADDGSFAIPRLRDGEYTLTAEDPRSGARAELSKVKADDAVTLTLVAPTRLVGHVTDRGAPVTDFELGCWIRSGLRTSYSRRFESADGSYVLDRIPPGNYGCSVTSLDGRAHDWVEVTAGSTTLDFTLERFATVTGTLVDVMTGEPLVGYRVGDISSRSSDDVRAGRNRPTDAAGRFLLPSVIATDELFLYVEPASPVTNSWARIMLPGVPAGEHRDIGRVEIVRPHDGQRGSLGFDARTEGDAVTITKLDAGGPAEAAGLRVGDVVRTIDGRSMAKLFPLRWDLIVSGQTYKLGLDRGIVSVVAIRR